jgi:hypothetical protein
MVGRNSEPDVLVLGQFVTTNNVVALRYGCPFNGTSSDIVLIQFIEGAVNLTKSQAGTSNL